VDEATKTTTGDWAALRFSNPNSFMEATCGGGQAGRAARQADRQAGCFQGCAVVWVYMPL
jgi:hypothetical protein